MPHDGPEQHVFISYSRKDLELAHRLYDELKQAQLHPWMDKYDLSPGENWKSGVRRAIERSKFVIVLLSSRSVERRGYLHSEIRHAMEVLEEFPEHSVFIIPVRLDECSPSHSRLNELQWLDLFPSWESGISRLVESLTSQPPKAAESKYATGLMPLREYAVPFLEALDRRYEPTRKVTGVPSGFRSLDDLTNGFQPGQLTVVAGRQCSGKTAFALNVADFAAKIIDASVALFSLDLQGELLFQRMLCSAARVDLYRMRTGRLTKDDWTRLTLAFGELTERKVYVHHSIRADIQAIIYHSEAVKHEHGLQLVIIDSFHLMLRPGRLIDRERRYSTIARSLKNLAVTLDVPIIVLSAIPDYSAARTDPYRPHLTDLREYGDLAQVTDLVLFLHRPELYEPGVEEHEGIAEVIVAKAPGGLVGTVPLCFVKEFTRFDNLDGNQ